MALAGDPVTFAAGRWAAKEAVAKALGTGFAGCPPAAVSVEQGPGANRWCAWRRAQRRQRGTGSISPSATTENMRRLLPL